MLPPLALAMLLALLATGAESPPAALAGDGRESTQTAAPAPESLFIALLATGPAYRAGVPPEQQPGFAGHAAHMRTLSVSGALILGGPYGDDPQRVVLSGAVLLLRAASLAEARRLVAADPGIASGLMRVATVSRWVPAAGALARAVRAPHEAR